MIDFMLQAVSTLLVLYGVWQVGNGRLRGPLVLVVANVITVYVGLTHGVWSIVCIDAALFFIQIRTLVKWHRELREW
jgi:hypothetical protein